jgi:8-oxo-dGTP pyrophosphatase MutT (NUDIX family)
MRHLHADAVHLLESWQAPTPGQDALRLEYLQFLATHSDGVSRDCHVGHLTSSALVVNPTRTAVLLTLHPKVGRWLQLGGHMEPEDAHVRAAAWRETHEESGVVPATLSIAPARLDRHPVPCGGALSEHLDVQFIAVVADDKPIHRSAESIDLAWFAMDDVPADLDPSVQALIAAARAESDVQESLG